MSLRDDRASRGPKPCRAARRCDFLLFAAAPDGAEAIHWCYDRGAAPRVEAQARSRAPGRAKAAAWRALQEALRVDIDLEPDLALGLGRGGEPLAQIGREIEVARRLDEQAE